VDFKTFDKCMILIRAWRSRTDQNNNEWPDSRDPSLRELLTEFSVVPQDLEKSMVALAAWREAGEDIYQKMSTITHVIRNRQKQGLFRTHLVSSGLDQFPTMTGDGSSGYPTETENFKKILQNLDIILEDKAVDLTQNAIYFGVVGDGMPDWFRGIVESTNYERTVQAANLTFYRERKK